MGKSRRMGPALGLARGTLKTFPLEPGSSAGKSHPHGEGKFFPKTILKFLTEQIPNLDHSARNRLAFLSRETDPQLFAYGLLHLAEDQQRAGKLEVARLLYACLAQQKTGTSDWAVPTMFVPQKVRARAAQHLGAMLGFGDSGRRLEYLGRGLIKEILNPTTLGSLAIAGGAYHWVRGISLARLGRWPAGIFTRGFGAEASASLLGFASEATLFPLSAKGIDALLGRPVDWSHLGPEIKASVLFLGGIKLGGWGSLSLLRKVHGFPISTSWRTRWQQSVIPPAGMFLGSLAGHSAGQTLGIVPKIDGATTLTDSAAMFLQYGLAGTVLRKTFPTFFRWQAQEPSLPQRFPPKKTGKLNWHLLSSAPALAQGKILPIESRLQPWEINLPLAAKAKSELPGSSKETKSSSESYQGTKNIFRSHELFTEALRRSRPIKKEKKMELIRKAQGGDQAAKEELMLSDLRYLARSVHRYRIRKRDFLDAVQEAAVGYLHALKKFDTERGVKFITYADWWIKSHIQIWLSRQNTVYVPENKSVVVRRVQKELEKRQTLEGPDQNLREIAREMDISEENLTLIEELAGYREASLEKPFEEGGGTLGDILPSERFGPEELTISPTLIRKLDRFYKGLSKRDRMIFRERFLNEEGKTLVEIGKKFSVSRERIRQVQEMLRNTLKKIISNKDSAKD